MLDFYLLIPCYNNTDGLIRSLFSVEYPKEKYKVMVVDDGSTVPVSLSEFPEALLQNQSIEIIRLPQNKGITEALNTGLRLILNRNDSLYTARLDCGDICRADRFTKQISFLSVTTDVALLGSLCLFVDHKKKTQFVYKAAEHHYAILNQMHLKCSFIHPTVIFRNEMIRNTKLYPYDYPYAEDYAFFFELTKKYKTHIIQEILVEAQIDTNGISVKKRQEQITSKIKIIKFYGVIKSLTCIGFIKQSILALLPYKLTTQIKHLLFRIGK
ncbi:glycosyltransferase [Lacibacter sp. H375]|uniref:glycosyltransferase n=1 Tax=Lacibacter sp. H375 TaxID=3133424 RepID=UPI0030BC02AC